MIYILLWVESLALCVLAVLWAFTFWQRGKHRPLGIITLVLTLLLAFSFTGAQLTVSIVLASVRVTPNYLFHNIAFTVALLGITGVLLRRGFRRDNDGGARRIVCWPLAQLGIAALAAFALYLTTMMTIDTTMQMKLANVRLEAGALAMSEAPLRPAERENAAVLYARAFERMDAARRWESYKAWTKANSWQNGVQQADHTNPEVRDYIAKLKPALDQLRRAAAMPACAFDRAYATPSMDMLLPELSQLREAARLLAMDARIRAAEGDVKGALEDIRAIQGISEHVSYEPILISGLVSVACNGIASDTLEHVLRSTEPTAADIEALGTDDLFSFRRVYRRSISGEYAFGLSGFAMLGDNNGPMRFDTVSMDDSLFLKLMGRVGLPYWRIYLMPEDLLAYKETMEIYKRSAGLTYKDSKAAIDPIAGPNAERRGILTAMVTPSISRAIPAFTGAEARLRLSILARAVCQYRAKNKAFPKDLAVLVPDYIGEIPNDPFDDKPLRMTSQAGGVTLYSVGTDAVDDGGKAPSRRNEQDNDILLRIGKVDEPAATQPAAAKPVLPAPPKTGF